jgi:hypothetical protein
MLDPDMPEPVVEFDMPEPVVEFDMPEPPVWVDEPPAVELSLAFGLADCPPTVDAPGALVLWA